MDTGEVSHVCTGGVSIVYTGECFLCAQGSVFCAYRGVCILRTGKCLLCAQGECLLCVYSENLLCTQGECFLFVCLIKGIYCWYNIPLIVHLVIKKKAVSTIIFCVWHKCMPQIWQYHNVSFLHPFEEQN